MPTEILGITASVNKQGVASIKIPMEAGTLLEALTCLPTTNYGAAVLGDRQVTQTEDGRFGVVLTLEGSSEEFTFDERTQDSYELDGSTSEEPIESHVRFNALATKYKAIYDESDRFIGWPRVLKTELANFGNDESKNPLYGLSGYLVGGAVWRRTYAASTLPQDILRNLGCIEIPPFGSSGKAPNLDGGRNWLKIRVTAALRGNVWQITQEWLASPPGGWNVDIYRKVS